MGAMHLAAQEMTVTPDWTGGIKIHSDRDARVINAGVERYRQLNGKHLETLKQGTFEEGGLYLLVQTSQSGFRVAETARTIVTVGGKQAEVERQVVEEPGYLAMEGTVEVPQQSSLRVEKS